MSGHSKWATIKHKKGALDAKRGKIFTRLLKEIAVAAKGGGNPDTNARLRTAVLAAKMENMPQDNIKRAIQRGTGELEGVNYEEISFEGYGPGGVAIIIDVMTDNRNRAVSEIRHAFTKNGGNLGENGSVRFMFSKKGVIAIEKSAATEDQLMDIVLEHGGEDLNDEGETWEILTDPASYESVLSAVKAAKIEPVMNEVTMVASTYTKLEGSTANQMVRLLEVLEDLDDTQNVYTNFDMDAAQMEEAAS
jgi:YebC/PmpR family DNA-binding regulatory protein